MDKEGGGDAIHFPVLHPKLVLQGLDLLSIFFSGNLPATLNLFLENTDMFNSLFALDCRGDKQLG